MNLVLEFIGFLEDALGHGAKVTLQKEFDDLLVQVDWPNDVHARGIVSGSLLAEIVGGSSDRILQELITVFLRSIK